MYSAVNHVIIFTTICASLKLFRVNSWQEIYSNKDSSDRLKQEKAYIFFVDFLDECEGIINGNLGFIIIYIIVFMFNLCIIILIEGHVDVKLSDVLIFFTGADRERFPQHYNF